WIGRLGFGEFEGRQHRRSARLDRRKAGLEPCEPAPVETIYVAPELSNGIPGPDGEEELELGISSLGRGQLLRHEAADHQARTCPERCVTAICRCERA